MATNYECRISRDLLLSTAALTGFIYHVYCNKAVFYPDKNDEQKACENINLQISSGQYAGRKK